MKMKLFSLRTQSPRAERAGTTRKLSNSFSLLPALVLLMVMGFVTATGLACSADSECRRNVCILGACAPRPLTNGVCSLDTQCFYAATESCINSQCLAKSPVGKVCDSPNDCSISGSSCTSSICTSPAGASCSINADCTSPLACIDKKCSTKSASGGDCDEVDDCAKAGDACTGGKCVGSFDPSLMVWDGNKAPVNPGDTTPTIFANGLLYAFEGFSVVALTTVEAYDPIAKTWMSKTGLDTYNSGFSVVAVGNNIFLIGGVDQNNAPQTTFFVYDTVNDKWDKTWDQLPEARYSCAAAAVDSIVFIFGGTGASNKYLDTIFSLDVSAKGKGWNLLSATLPDATNSLSAVTVDKDIFLTGGNTASGWSKAVLKFNTLTPTVSPSASGLNPMVQARFNHMTFYDPTNKRLYAAGGYNIPGEKNVEVLDLTADSSGSWASANAPNYVNLGYSTSGGLIGSLFHFTSGGALQVLDVSVPASVKWTPFANSPSPSSSIIQMTSPTTIMVVDTGLQKISLYDTDTNTWTAGATATNFPSNPTNAPSVLVNGELYLMGGSDFFSASQKVYALNAAGNAWDQKDDMPALRPKGCAAAYGTDIYHYGGTNGRNSDPTNDLFLMDTTKAKGSNLQWTTVTPAGETPTAVTNCAAVVANGKLLIFGGSTASVGGSPTDLIQSFDLATKTWDSPLSAKITPRSRLSAVLLKGFVFITGGYTTSTKLLAKTEVFNVATKTVSVIADMPTPRYSPVSVTDDSSIFSVGGWAYFTYFPSLEKLHSP